MSGGNALVTCHSSAVGKQFPLGTSAYNRLRELTFASSVPKKQPSVAPYSGANVCQNAPSMRISHSPPVLLSDLFSMKVELSAARVFIDSDTGPEPAPKSAREFAFQP